MTFKPLPERRNLDLSADIFQKAGEPLEALLCIEDGDLGNPPSLVPSAWAALATLPHNLIVDTFRGMHG